MTAYEIIAALGNPMKINGNPKKSVPFMSKGVEREGMRRCDRSACWAGNPMKIKGNPRKS